MLAVFVFKRQVVMLKISNISKSYGIETILKDINLVVSPGERLGLIGSNGSGKTTLLRLIARHEQADSGSIQLDPPSLRIGYLPQGQHPRPFDTLESYLSGPENDLQVIEQDLMRLAAKLAETPQDVLLQQTYDQVLYRLEQAVMLERLAPLVLAGLGLGGLSKDLPVAHLSGGQKTRLALAGVLLAQPKLLLLDEPTNHLDIEMLEWLEDWLCSSPQLTASGMLVVSHDRAFLDRIATGILELDPVTHTLRSFSGNYSAYLEHKIAEQEKRWQAYRDQQDEIGRLRRSASAIRSVARFRKGGKADTNDKFARGFFGNRSAGTVRRAKALEQRLENLQTEDRLEKPRSTWQMKLDFGAASASGRDVLRLDDLSIGFDGVTLVSGISASVQQGSRIALIGPNGAGKTTLLRTLAGRLPVLVGEMYLGLSVRLGYMAQEQEELDPQVDVLRTIMMQAAFTETAGRTFLHQFLFTGDDVFTLVGNLSYGERARLTLACLVAQGCNLLLLDEPINHLDIPARASFEKALASYHGAVIAVVHDRFFIEGFASEVWEIQQSTLTRQVRDASWIE